MYAIPVTIEQGIPKIPPNSKLPFAAKSGILILDDDIHPNDDLDSLEFKLAAMEGNPSLDFLLSEPDLYSAADIQPADRNPFFVKR